MLMMSSLSAMMNHSQPITREIWPHGRGILLLISNQVRVVYFNTKIDDLSLSLCVCVCLPVVWGHHFYHQQTEHQTAGVGVTANQS